MKNMFKITSFRFDLRRSAVLPDQTMEATVMGGECKAEVSLFTRRISGSCPPMPCGQEFLDRGAIRKIRTSVASISDMDQLERKKGSIWELQQIEDELLAVLSQAREAEKSDDEIYDVCWPEPVRSCPYDSDCDSDDDSAPANKRRATGGDG